MSNAVEQLITVVQKVVTAIGDAVMVGINMLVHGIEQVFHCKIQFLEDIAAAISSFFNMLEKVLSDVLEALSILFHFGEIIKTQQWLKQWLSNRMALTEGDKKAPRLDMRESEPQRPTKLFLYYGKSSRDPQAKVSE